MSSGFAFGTLVAQFLTFKLEFIFLLESIEDKNRESEWSKHESERVEFSGVRETCLLQMLGNLLNPLFKSGVAAVPE